MSLLSIQHVTKQYANHRALDDVSMEIPASSIFGLLGPNGAGKTSLIRIINQITAADTGKIIFDGEPLSAKHISLIGYLPEERGLYKKMQIGEQVLYFAQLKGLSRADALHKVKYWFDKFEIKSWWKKKVEELSKGMQQKVQFIVTVLHEPKLIILDEPFTGFDPVNAEIIKNEIIELKKKGATILFSTHRMESVDQMCDNIAMIHKSRKVLEGSISSIRTQFKKSDFIVEFEGELPGMNHQIKLLSKTELNGHHTGIFKLENGATPNELLSHLLPHVNIKAMQERIPSINDIFISIVKENPHE
jgi:ABC-2 type transport system ATP-binding protein